jgi:hypothetical protein
MTSSNFVGCFTGRSAGRAPLKTWRVSNIITCARTRRAWGAVSQDQIGSLRPCHGADKPWHLAPILSEHAGQVKPEPRSDERKPLTGALSTDRRGRPGFLPARLCGRVTAPAEQSARRVRALATRGRQDDGVHQNHKAGCAAAVGDFRQRRGVKKEFTCLHRGTKLRGENHYRVTMVAPTGYAHRTSYSLRGPSPCRLEGIAQREPCGNHDRPPAAPVHETRLAPPPWHELVPRSSRSLCLTSNAPGGNAVDARNLSSARGVISWSRRSPLRCLALGAFAMPPTSASSTSTTGSLRRSPPSPGGNSGRACGRLTSTNS